MTQEQWTAVDAYITDLLVSSDSALDAALEASAAASLPSINVTPNQGKLLQLLAQACGARRILELGTLGGYSTIWLARALPADGHLITLESDSTHARVARANIAQAGLSPCVDVRLGAALETLPQLVAGQCGPFDFIFLDAATNNYPAYLPLLPKLSRRGTILVADNLVRNGAVINAASTDVLVQGVRKFNELLAATPGTETTLLQTVGVKGYDGFAVSIIGGDS